MSDPYTTPSLYDVFTLDYVPHPGVSTIDGGGERAEDFQDQQVPLTTGATTLFRFEPNGEITYAIKLLQKDFPTWEAFVAMLNEGKARRPQPRVYVLADARLEDVQMTTVSFERIGPRMVKRGSETTVKLTLKEVRRQKPYGGAAVPDDPKFVADVKAQYDRRDTNLSQIARLEAAHAAARAGK